MHILWGRGGRSAPPKFLQETPCAPCRNPDRTTPTPSTTGGTAEATPRTRSSETGPPAGRAIGRRETGGAAPGTGPETGWEATPRTIGGPRSSPSGRHQAAAAGNRDGGRPDGRARRPPTRAVGAAGAPRSRCHGAGAGNREGTGSAARAAAWKPARCGRGNPAAEQVDVQRGPSISYIEGPRTCFQDDACSARIRGTTRAHVAVLTADRPAPGGAGPPPRPHRRPLRCRS